MIIAKFDDGRIISKLISGINFNAGDEQSYFADGYIEISKEDWEYYIGVHGNGDNGTGYIRDPKTGKPVSAPAYVPTVEEKLAALDSQYAADKKVLANYYLDAALAGDTDTQNALRDEMMALNEQYDADVKALKGE